jgi:hypothetical protein
VYYYQGYLLLHHAANFLAQLFHIYATSDSKVTLQAGQPSMTGVATSLVRDGEPVAQLPSLAPTAASAASTDPGFVH